jgi:hypothetical protein
MRAGLLHNNAHDSALQLRTCKDFGQKEVLRIAPEDFFNLMEDDLQQ